jgi:uncharacterized protein YutE (UPF0331/DUF86 family)
LKNPKRADEVEVMTIDELKEYCDEEFRNIDRVIKELFSIYKPEKSEYILAEQAAIAAFIMNIYSGVENILKQMLIFNKLDITDSSEEYEKVLRKAGEIGILPPDLYQVFSKYLSFRNYFISTYVFNIKWEELKVLVDAIRDVIAKFKSEVEEYIQTI